MWKWRVELMKSWGTDGFVWNWQIIGAEKEQSLCGSDVLKWRLCGSEGCSKNCFIRPLMLIRAPLGQKGLCLLEKLKPGLKMAQRHQLRPPIPNECSEIQLIWNFKNWSKEKFYEWSKNNQNLRTYGNVSVEHYDPVESVFGIGKINWRHCRSFETFCIQMIFRLIIIIILYLVSILEWHKKGL